MQIRTVALVLLAGLAAGRAGASAATQTPAIVFSADRAPALTGEIYRLDGSGRRVDLSRSPFFDTQPAVSPDGSHVAFLSDRHGAVGVYDVRIDGTRLTRLATPPLPSTPDDGPIQLAWSPTGRLLALTATIGSMSKLSLLRPGGPAVVAARGRYFFSPVWSPDGRLVIVQARPDFGSSPEIRAFTPAGAPVWRINSGDSFAAWSVRGLLKTVDRGSVRVPEARPPGAPPASPTSIFSTTLPRSGRRGPTGATGSRSRRRGVTLRLSRRTGPGAGRSPSSTVRLRPRSSPRRACGRYTCRSGT